MSSVFFYEPFYDFERLFDEAFSAHQAGSKNQVQQRNAAGQGAVRCFRPRMDLHEDSDKNPVTATFEHPGLVKENVNIDIHDNRLTVSAESKQANKFQENSYAVCERQYGRFSRTLQLPQGIKSEEIKANMENGILTVTFPKSTPELAPKKKLPFPKHSIGYPY